MFENIIQEAESDLRDLLEIPDNYKVTVSSGRRSQQFAMIPMNLMKNRVADYIVTGQWAKKAWQEAQKYGKANKIALLKIRPILIYRTVQIFLSALMRIMYISVRTIPFTAQSSKNFQIPRERPWWQMYLPAFCQNL